MTDESNAPPATAPEAPQATNESTSPEPTVSNDTVGKTFLVAFLLCLVCSVFVSLAAVGLGPAKDANKELDLQRNLLLAAGLIEKDASDDKVRQEFDKIEPNVIVFSTGEYDRGIDASTYDQKKAARDPAQSTAVDGLKDVAQVRRRANKGLVYLAKENDTLTSVILPIHGYGLWSTLYGFVALEASDLNTIEGLGYYQHAETPGLGGEVDHESWKAQWKGARGKKKVFDADGNVAIEVIKGIVADNTPGSEHQIDGLAGATITSRGVTNTFQYWLGPDGYGPYLSKLKDQLKAANE